MTWSRTTALVVVDVQNDFADPDGGLYVRGGEQVVPVVNDAVARARAAGAVVVASEAGEVLTSGRQVGRTRGGYAGYLANDLLA